MQEFENYVKRDQLFSFVLYKTGIRAEEVAAVGGDAHKDTLFEIIH